MIVSEPPDAERPGTHPSSEPSEGINPAHTLILAFWPPELRDKVFLLVKPPGLGYFGLAALQTNTPASLHWNELGQVISILASGLSSADTLKDKN